jgi:hypothetical protein
VIGVLFLSCEGIKMEERDSGWTFTTACDMPERVRRYSFHKKTDEKRGLVFSCTRN